MYSTSPYCRLCLQTSDCGSLVEIFKDNLFEGLVDPCEIIRTFLGIDISQDDGLSRVLCRKCIGIITLFKDYRGKVNTNNDFLKGVLNIAKSRPSDKAVTDSVVEKSNVALEKASNSTNYRRPGPKSKRRPIRSETCTSVETSRSTPTLPTNEVEVSNNFTLNSSAQQNSTSNSDQQNGSCMAQGLQDAIYENITSVSENSDQQKIDSQDATHQNTTSNSETSDQQKSDDILSDASTILLDQSKNARSNPTTDSDNAMDLDQSSFAQVPVTPCEPSKSLEKTDEIDIPTHETPEVEDDRSNSKRRGRPCKPIHFCEHCNRPFFNKHQYKDHKLQHKVLSTRMFVCKVCKMAYSNNLDVEKHHPSFHPFASLDTAKHSQSDDIGQVAIASEPQVDNNQQTNNTVNFDIIETAEQTPPTTPVKRKRMSKQSRPSSKRVRTTVEQISDKRHSENVTVAEIHTTPDETSNLQDNSQAQSPTKIIDISTAPISALIPASTQSSNSCEKMDCSDNIEVIPDDDMEGHSILDNKGSKIDVIKLQNTDRPTSKCNSPATITNEDNVSEVEDLKLQTNVTCASASQAPKMAASKEEKVCNKCNTFKSISMKEIFIHKKNCRKVR
ncbi:PR domain zinc finger protein 2 isoform X2 [Nilaparvata lugens]|uniref:PR domain zinc finger protein 2 isoform X2 n=1 Tax=Nilaparvata lugens TaxID=108931 RepID=UPI00193D6BFB|nr:PR domain zinc finger protein 2 isoform X2 [Nilaparvata lugens]